MSTKSTITHDKNFHIYQELFDSQNIFIEIKDINIEFSTFNSKNNLKIKLSKEMWQKIITSYENNKFLIDNNDFDDKNIELQSKFIDIFSNKESNNEK